MQTDVDIEVSDEQRRHLEATTDDGNSKQKHARRAPCGHERIDGRTVRETPPPFAGSAREVRIPNRDVINAILHVVENSRKWRALLESWDKPVAKAPLAKT